MQVNYKKRWSSYLQRDMEFKVYGNKGKPFLMIPCQSGRFYEFEDMHMLDVYAPYIERGEIQIFTIDSIDSETLNNNGSPRKRIERHENWINYLVYEAIPEFRLINKLANGGIENKFAVCGLSLGSLHAATLYFRFPDFFDRLLGLSGLYSNEYYFKDYHDDLTYNNSPEQFLANINQNHSYIEKYNKGKIILCVGQGEWEDVPREYTIKFANILKSKKINVWLDVWGKDVKHDWCWWYKQAEYFIPKLLEP